MTELSGVYTWLLLFGVLLWGGMAIWYVRQQAASVYHPATLYLLFHGVIFALRPVLAAWLGYDGLYVAYRFMPSMMDKVTVLLGADLALILFVVVSVRVGGEPFKRASARERGQPPRLDLPYWLMALTCGPPALLSLWQNVGERASGAGSMILDAGTGIAINTTSNGYFTDAMLMLGPIVVLFAWTARFRLWSLLPLAVFVIAKAGSGGRWPFVMALISCMMFWMYERRLRWPSPRLFVAALPLAALFIIVGEDRGAGVRNLFSASSTAVVQASYFNERPLESMDFGNMEFFEYLVTAIPAKSGTYDYFLNNLQVFTEPIPRALWPGKPIGAPIQPIKLWKYGTPIGMTASLPGMGWMQAGWIGIIIWASLFAVAYGKLYNAYVRCDQNRFQTAAYLTVLPISLAVFRDGTILTALKMSLFTLLPVLLWSLYGRIAGKAFQFHPKKITA